MLRTFVVLVLGAHGIGHLIGVAGGWFNSAWGGSSTSWLLTPPWGALLVSLRARCGCCPASGSSWRPA